MKWFGWSEQDVDRVMTGIRKIRLTESNAKCLKNLLVKGSVADP
jgi:hypothetical protein